MRKINFTKPVAVIFNPASGKKKDIRPLIEKKFKENNIKVEFFETQRVMHAWLMAK